MSKRKTQWLAVVVALAVAGFAVAEDRDFLRQVSAAPNLIFILDTSSSMVASPEVTLDGDPAVPTPIDGALVASANVPGGGDDPYSRMGIAKRVLREFLDDVGDANVALAGYAQAEPADASAGIAQKHWVYEARAQDRFHMIEATYAYRLGYSETHSGFLLDVPADIMKNRLIGYKLYFDPTSDVTTRFGPLNAYDAGYVDYTVQNPIEGLPDVDVLAPFDLMPIYFSNCFLDNKETPGDDTDDEIICGDGKFPFYDSGIRDVVSGDLIPSEWYYGEADDSVEDYPGCDPNEPTWDDGFGSPVLGACENEWEETVGANTIIYQRRVRLEIPSTYGGADNHFIEIDNTGAQTGNTQVSDGGAEDYDLDGFADPDYDGNETNDWMLYVNSVEERRSQTCVAGASFDTPTPTLTPTLTPTETPSPTYTPTPVCRVTVENMRSMYDYMRSTNYMGATITNGHATTATITRIYWDWADANLRKWAYNDWMRICTDGATNPCGSYSEEVWDDSSGSYSVVPYTGRYARPLEVTGPPYTGMYNNPQDAQISAGVTTHWWAYVRDSVQWQWDGVYEVCFDFLIPGDAPGGGDLTCPDVCAVTYEGSFGTPTPTLTPTVTLTPTPLVWPTVTSTPTPFVFSTNTPTSPPSGPTNTPAPLATSTPTPWPTPTNPPTPTNTPPPTATPVS